MSSTIYAHTNDVSHDNSTYRRRTTVEDCEEIEQQSLDSLPTTCPYLLLHINDVELKEDISLHNKSTDTPHTAVRNVFSTTLHTVDDVEDDFNMNPLPIDSPHILLHISEDLARKYIFYPVRIGIDCFPLFLPLNHRMRGS